MKLPLILLISACAHAKPYQSENMKFDVEKVVSREDVVWGFDFFSDGRMILINCSLGMRILGP